ncbi:MAG: MmgE/PrpD family protein [Candidatus Tectomicrobia bacterium]|uniref:MmgE/PrpD family protein n=1 Tax=Tectimicrobiota bacterium TaxID=2528274 RepID=A0A932I3X9_UNCTE|nr:MmgE/PrpD family protein [Candidatus Tectomicrobia bacterium]
METPPSAASERICRFAETLRYEAIPPDVVEKVKLLALDVIGIALAAHSTPVDAPLRAAARALTGRPKGEEGGDLGPASAVGEKRRMPAAGAALLNGALGHALDFDDTHTLSVIHTAAPVIPAALAGAEAFGKSGREMLRAAVAGFESEIRIGLAAPGRFHARGFHMTAIAGTFGAALAYGLLAGLDGRRLVSALGICGSMAAGLFEYLEDGSPVKALHPGWAAHAGIAAAALAEGGFGGPPTVIEGRFGLLRSHLEGEAFDAAAVASGLGERWETLATAFKPYPCGHVIHAFLDAALRVQRERGFAPEAITSILCHAAPGAIALVLEPAEAKCRPRTEYDAKFSLPYCLGSVLVRGRCGVGEFEGEAIHDPRVLEVASKVSYRREDGFDFPRFLSGRVEIRLKDGSTFAAEEKYQRGCPENPLSVEDLKFKFLDNACRSLSRPRAEALAEAILGLDSLASVEPVAGILRNA